MKIASDNEISIEKDLVVGQTLVIDINNDKKFRNLDVNGFAYSNINMDTLANVLPSLTYLSIFSYSILNDGNLKTVNDNELISMAKKYNVIPVMVVTNIGENGRFSSELAHFILNSELIQYRLIANILNIMKEKGYGGLNIDFEYIFPEDKDAFIDFLSRVKEEINKYEYFLSVAVAPKNSDNQEGILYEAHDYEKIGKIADWVIIMTYEWGYSGGPARAVAPVNLIQKVLDYAVSIIPSDKIMMGIPNYGYDWTLPFVEGNIAKSVGNYEAVDIARDKNQSINYNYETQSPYFNYYDENLVQHEVWFEDARSIQAKLELVLKYNLKGVSYWTINRFFPQNYLVLNSLFTIKKEI